jgi:hypothetical protein
VASEDSHQCLCRDNVCRVVPGSTFKQSLDGDNADAYILPLCKHLRTLGIIKTDADGTCMLQPPPGALCH